MPDPRCTCCNGETPRQHRRRVRREVDRRGFFLQGVVADRGASFAYTVGLAAADLPEVIAYHRFPECAAAVLEDLAPRLLEGEQFDDGGDVRGLLTRELPARLHVVTEPAEVFVAQELYGDVAVRQLVLPDEEGRFPYETGYCGDRVPLLFPPPAPWPFSWRRSA